MKTVKRVSSDWDIYADTVTINGNLVVVGQTTSVESVDTLVYDNFITLAAGRGGGPTLNAGIEVDRGASPRVGIRWYEAQQLWQYTNDGSLWKTFSLTRVEEDLDPHLGGNLIVNDYTITSDAGHDVVVTSGTGGNLIIGPVIRVPQITTDPAPLAGHSTIYAKATEAGDTGVFVSNEKVTGRELISKRKAFIYSIIF